MQNSNLFDMLPDHTPCVNGYYDPVLLTVTTYAALYRVRKSGRYFLIKTTKDNSQQARAILHREYEMSVGCDHPHLVHVYIFEESTPVGPGIVMEYVEGRTLSDYLAENPAPAARRRVFEELLSVVDYLHKRGVIHNDLKPENILVTRNDNSIKLIDFGLSDNDAWYLYRTPGCTPGFASPELLTGQVSPDARSDIYSIGCLMQLIFAGKYSRIVRRCMKPDRSERFEHVEQLQQCWQRRHYLFYGMLIALSVVLAVLPSVLYLNERGTRAEFLRAEARRLEQRDSAYLHLEQVKARYEFLTDSLERQLAAEACRRELRDSLFRYFEQRIDSNYRELKDSVDTCPYSDMASVYLCDFTYRWRHLYKELDKLDLASELSDQIRTRIERLSEGYSNQLYEIVSRKPVFPRDSLPREETFRILNRISERISRFQ